jgi:hypothetical protein
MNASAFEMLSFEQAESELEQERGRASGGGGRAFGGGGRGGRGPGGAGRAVGGGGRAPGGAGRALGGFRARAASRAAARAAMRGGAPPRRGGAIRPPGPPRPTPPLPWPPAVGGRWPRPWPRPPVVWPAGGGYPVALGPPVFAATCMPCPPCPAAGDAPPTSAAAPDASAPAANGNGAAAPPAGGNGGAPAAGGDTGGEGEFGAIGSFVSNVAGRIGDVVGRVIKGLGGCDIIDLTATSDKTVEKGTRDPKKVFALVLHQMACCHMRRDPLKSYLSIGSHYAILPDGRILQLHGVDKLIWASHGFNNGSVAVEFAGNFPNIHGKWWKGETYGRNKVTLAQVEAGRCLIRHLVATIGLRTVLAHRQSSDMRENDPGPDLWYNVGQWAVNTLGLSDGGPGYKHGTGKPIPDEWRSWGSAGLVKESEAEAAYPAESLFEFDGESDAELWRGEPEGDFQREMSFDQALNDPRAQFPGLYTIFVKGQRVYVGKADNLRKRLQAHHWYLKKHASPDCPISQYTVKLTPMKDAPTSKVLGVESKAIQHWGTTKTGGPLRNVRTREFEILEVGGLG